jgi:hypothetical protein
VAAGNDRTAHLTWQAGTEPDLDHYSVYAARQSFEKPDQCRLVASPTTPEFIDWGLASGETYHYAVTAVDRRGNESALSGRVDAPVPARPYPPQQIELSFDQATVSGTVERLQAPGTHAKQYVMVPEKAAEAEVAAVGASWEVNIEHAGKHYFWLRYLPKGKASDRDAAVRQDITVLLDGTKITTLARGMTDLSTPDSNIRPEFWTWARPIDFDLIGVELPAGKHTLTLKELTKAIRYDVLLITDGPAFRPKDGRLRQTF